MKKYLKKLDTEIFPFAFSEEWENDYPMVSMLIEKNPN